MKKMNNDKIDNDKMDKLFEYQNNFQKKLKIINDTQYKEKMIIAATDELFECLHCLPWKPWKSKMDYNELKFKEEIIDVWHFLINLTLSSGMDSEELYTRYLTKLAINYKRQEEKY